LKIRELKKQATDAKKNDINKSIQLMKDAIQLEEQLAYGDDSVIADYIRMAKYIYVAGKKDESWKLYNDLILRCGSINDAFLRWHLLYNIYWAMGQQLEKEEKHSEALLTYLISGFCSSKSRIDAIKEYQTLESSGLIESEKESLCDDIESMFNEDRLYMKEKPFLCEKRIRRELASKSGGKDQFAKDLITMNLNEFIDRANQIIKTFK
jgi:hypothetical protein